MFSRNLSKGSDLSMIAKPNYSSMPKQGGRSSLRLLRTLLGLFIQIAEPTNAIAIDNWVCHVGAAVGDGASESAIAI